MAFVPDWRDLGDSVQVILKTEAAHLLGPKTTTHHHDATLTHDIIDKVAGVPSLLLIPLVDIFLHPP